MEDSTLISEAPSPTVIRHAGKAHVRGRIRRVWRPRYLELTSDGRLQYYEYASSDEQPVVRSDATSRTTTLKYTLVVTAARILDVTTIRDLHTGLMRGSFGFLIRGQRVTEASSATASHHPPLVPAPQTPDDPVALLDTPLAASFLLAADESLHGSLCATATGDGTMVSTAEPVRDYLCAVPTLEDAQMWVVALQWAASCHTNRLASPLLSTPLTSTNTAAAAAAAVADQWWKVDYFSSPKTDAAPVAAPAVKEQDDPPTGPPGDAVQMNPTVSTHTATTTAPPTRQGKILVTAVTNYTLIRWTGWTLEIAYDIHAMLLYDDTGETSPTSMAEQWSIRRTATQLEQLAVALQGRSSSHGTPESDDVQVIRQLPQWNQRPTTTQVDQSLSVVDSLLRSWVLSAEIANTAALKQFLGLTDASVTVPVALKIPWWHVHADQPHAIAIPKVQQPVPSTLTKESFVKDWLLRVRAGGRSKAGSAQGLPQWLLTCRHESHKVVWTVGGVVMASSVAPSLIRAWYRFMPVVPMRLDVLVASWAGVSYLGYWFHSNNSAKASKSRHLASGSAKAVPRKTKHSSSTSLRRLESAKRVSKDHQVPTILHATLRGKDTPTEHASGGSVIKDDSTLVMVPNDDSVDDDFAEFASTGSRELFDVVVGDDDDESDGDVPESSEDGVDGLGTLDDELSKSTDLGSHEKRLSSPLPQYPDNNGLSCWSQPRHDIFHVRGAQYFTNKVKVCSGPAPLQCRGVDIWLTDNPERHIARNPAVLGGKLGEKDTFLVNFLLPFGNFVSYFAIPPLREFPDKLGTVWTKFLKGDQEYRDARLKLLPVVVDGPWIVKTAVGPGKSPALLGKAIPLQYYFRDPDGKRKGVYEVDVIITASSIAKGILSIVKSQTKSVSIAFAFIIEAAEQSELPETVLCCFQVHSLHLEDCPTLPNMDRDDD